VVVGEEAQDVAKRDVPSPMILNGDVVCSVGV
jgi:hypothetical protein